MLKTMEVNDEAAASSNTDKKDLSSSRDCLRRRHTSSRTVKAVTRLDL